jgi:hypothetical protein
VKSLRMFILAAALAACSDSGPSPLEPVTPPPTLAGTWHATVFQITAEGLPTFDMLELGANLTLSIDAQGRTTGKLVAPFGSPETDMAGQATITGNRVTFDQVSETFVRLLAWSLHGDTLSVTNEALGETRFTVTLVRR